MKKKKPRVVLKIMVVEKIFLHSLFMSNKKNNKKKKLMVHSMNWYVGRKCFEEEDKNNKMADDFYRQRTFLRVNN